MKKKLIIVALILALAFSMFACAKKEEPKQEETQEETESGEAAKIAVVTDVGQLMDKGFNQGTYEGAQAYAEANGITMKYYQPANGSDATDNDRIDAM